MSAACPVLGVVVRLDPPFGGAIDAVLSALAAEILRPRGLVASAGARQGEIVITGDGFQASDSDREAIVAWLSGQPLVGRHEVSQLGDVGHAA